MRGPTKQICEHLSTLKLEESLIEDEKETIDSMVNIHNVCLKALNLALNQARALGCLDDLCIATGFASAKIRQFGKIRELAAKVIWKTNEDPEIEELFKELRKL